MVDGIDVHAEGRAGYNVHAVRSKNPEESKTLV